MYIKYISQNYFTPINLKEGFFKSTELLSCARSINKLSICRAVGIYVNYIVYHIKIVSCAKAFVYMYVLRSILWTPATIIAKLAP